MVVPPVYVSLPASVRMPMPACIRLPLPLMTWGNVTASPWLKTRLPLSNTLLVPPIEAPLPPLPTWSVPAEIVVLPV